jgi:hypothetical protein
VADGWGGEGEGVACLVGGDGGGGVGGLWGGCVVWMGLM